MTKKKPRPKSGLIYPMKDYFIRSEKLPLPKMGRG
jgi:hypothetical protein